MAVPPLDKALAWREEADATEDAKSFLRGIQGNILQGHKRDHVTLLLLQFSKPDRPDVFAQLSARERRRIARLHSQFARTEQEPVPTLRLLDTLRDDPVFKRTLPGILNWDQENESTGKVALKELDRLSEDRKSVV